MLRPPHRRGGLLASCALFGCLASTVAEAAQEARAEDWVELTRGVGLGAWEPAEGWRDGADATPMEFEGRASLDLTEGEVAAIANAPGGRSADIVSAQAFGDCEVHVEFLVPAGSNSGVYLMDRYEVQILDSYGKEAPGYSDCGGIYARRGPDGNFEGTPPARNAAKPAGEWQSYDILFRAPRFAEDGTKLTNACFVQVLHNGQLIHDNVVVSGPTGGGKTPEVASAPLRLQGDHGPIAYRNMRVRPLELETPQTAAPTDALINGFTHRVYEIDAEMERLYDRLEDQTPNFEELRAVPDMAGAEAMGAPADYFQLEWLGYVNVPAAGRWGLRLESDDGSRLVIDGEEVLLHDGLHGATPKDTEVILDAGLHTFRIDHFENAGGEELRWMWRPEGGEWEVIPTEHLFTERDVTRVISAGPKVLLGPNGPLVPGDGRPLDRVHPGYRVVDLRPEGFEPLIGGLTQLPNGDLALTDFPPNQDSANPVREPNGTIWRVKGVAAAEGPDDVEILPLADGFVEPAGLLWHDGSLYVSERYQITRILDADEDGFYEMHEKVADGWTSDNYHHFTFGLAAKGDKLYGTLSTSIDFGPEFDGENGINGPNPPNRGTLVEVDLKTGEVAYLAGGFRTPNGIGVGPKGELLVPDNQGSWNPANSLYDVRPGRFYGHYNGILPGNERYPDGGHPGPFDDQPVSPPAVYLPQGECANSPTQAVAIPDGIFSGQVFLGELTGGGIRRVFLETVQGERQGAVFRFTQGLESGVNRLIRLDDGTLVIGGTGAGGNWNWRGTKHGLQKLVPTGEVPFEILSCSARSNGFQLRFTQAVPVSQLADPERYNLSQWHYAPTRAYGGPKVDLEKLEVIAAEPDADGKGVRLRVAGLKADRVVHLGCRLTDTAGNLPLSPECWYTLNFLPTPERTTPPRVLVFSKTAGFRHGSIPKGVGALGLICSELGWRMDATEDARRFSVENLAKYDAVVFLSTTGDVLNEAQQAAFEAWVRAGGGYLGIHAAADTEYDWPFYGELVGAYFKGHPPVQAATVQVVDRDHPATARLPEEWERRDEWYDYRALPREEVRVLARLNPQSYEGHSMGADHPIAWCHESLGGRALYTGGGHTPGSFNEEGFRAHLAGALRWICRVE